MILDRTFNVAVKIVILLLTVIVAESSQPKQIPAPAALVEATEYEPCDYNCGLFNHPTTAYCISVGDEIFVGKRAGFLWLGEADQTSMRNLAGHQILARTDARSIWITDGNGRTIKIKLGTNFEQFKDIRCLVEVHKPKLASAAKAIRPNTVPANAFALAGSQIGDYRPRFVWFSCATSASDTIDCLKWYPDGTSRGVERYCTRTIDGAYVSSDFAIDRLASREGQIVLNSGAILQFDHRGRINEKLNNSSQACY